MVREAIRPTRVVKEGMSAASVTTNSPVVAREMQDSPVVEAINPTSTTGNPVSSASAKGDSETAEVLHENLHEEMKEGSIHSDYKFDGEEFVDPFAPRNRRRRLTAATAATEAAAAATEEAAAATEAAAAATEAATAAAATDATGTEATPTEAPVDNKQAIKAQSATLRKSNSANSLLGLNILLNPQASYYEAAAMNNYYGFKVSHFITRCDDRI
jgi:hypothetical protein